MEKYYLYEWIRLEYNEPFYVGKGKKNRCYNIDRRNKYFKGVINEMGGIYHEICQD